MESNRKRDPELAGYLRTVILSSGLSNETIAEKLNVSSRIISFYCNGKRKPCQKTLLRLLRIANVNVKDIPF